MFYSIMKSGKKITIKDADDAFSPTTFYCDGDRVKYDNDALGYDCVHDLFTADHNAFEQHINKMIAGGMTIVISQK